MKGKEGGGYQGKKESEGRYGTVRYSTVRYSTVRYSTVRYSTVRYGAVGRNGTERNGTVEVTEVRNETNGRKERKQGRNGPEQ